MKSDIEYRKIASTMLRLRLVKELAITVTKMYIALSREYATSKYAPTYQQLNTASKMEGTCLRCTLINEDNSSGHDPGKTEMMQSTVRKVLFDSLLKPQSSIERCWRSDQ